jgi:hypothetical protein
MISSLSVAVSLSLYMSLSPLFFLSHVSFFLCRFSVISASTISQRSSLVLSLSAVSPAARPSYRPALRFCRSLSLFSLFLYDILSFLAPHPPMTMLFETAATYTRWRLLQDGWGNTS